LTTGARKICHICTLFIFDNAPHIQNRFFAFLSFIRIHMCLKDKLRTVEVFVAIFAKQMKIDSKSGEIHCPSGQILSGSLTNSQICCGIEAFKAAF